MHPREDLSGVLKRNPPQSGAEPHSFWAFHRRFIVCGYEDKRQVAGSTPRFSGSLKPCHPVAQSHLIELVERAKLRATAGQEAELPRQARDWQSSTTPIPRVDDSIGLWHILLGC